jgi:hypothetical protein
LFTRHEVGTSTDITSWASSEMGKALADILQVVLLFVGAKLVVSSSNLSLQYAEKHSR